MHRRLALSRKGFLALGASGVATAATGAFGPGLAAAAPQPPAPQGDDLGFLAFGAVAEGASRVFYGTALATPGLFDDSERRRLTQALKAKREHIIRLSTAMGPDAVGPGDYEVDLPKSSFTTRDRALALGEQSRKGSRCPCGGGKAKKAASDGDKAGLRQQLPGDAPPAGTDGQPHDHVASPCLAPREEQVCHIHACDQQHDEHDRGEHTQRRSVLAPKSIGPAGGRDDGCGKHEAAVASTAESDPWPRHVLAIRRVDDRRRGRGADAGFEPRHNRHVRPAVERLDEVGFVL